MSRGPHINKRPPRVYPKANRYAVYDAIAAEPGITEQELARRLNVSFALIAERLCSLETPGLLVYEDDNDHLFIYKE